MTSTSSDALRSCAEDARVWSDAALDAGWLSESDKALVNSLSGAVRPICLTSTRENPWWLTCLAARG